jgi:hypothetical protein
MGGSTKTYTNIQVNSVITDYEDGYDTVMLDANKSILKNDLSYLVSTLGKTMSDNRSAFNEGFLNAMGYNPSENIKVVTIDDFKLLDWSKNNIDTEITEVKDIRTGIPTSNDIAIKYLQTNYSCDYYTKKLVFSDNKEYKYISSVYISEISVSATLLLNKYDTVDEYVTLNYDSSYSVLDYGNFVEDPLGVNYWEVNLEHVYTVVEEGVTNEYVEVVSITVPAVYTNEDIQISKEIVEINEYVLNTYNGTSREISGTVGVFDPLVVWRARFNTSVSITSEGYVVTVTYSIIYLRDSKYLTDVIYMKNSIESGTRNEIDEYVSSNFDFLTFKYVLDSKVYIYYILKEDVVNVVSYKNTNAFPIIPIKRRKSFVNTDRNRKVVLNKIGMVGDEFNQSLASEDVYSAYLFFGLNLKDTSTVATKYLFELLDSLGGGGGNIADGNKFNYYDQKLTLRYSGLNIITGLNLTGVTKSGSIGPVGTYRAYTETYEVTLINEENGGSEYTELRTRQVKEKQISEFFYRKISITSARTSYDVDGKTDNLESDDKAVYIPVVSEVLNKLPFKDYMYIVSKSLQLLVLTRVKVKVKWYQSGFFKFVMTVVSVVVAFYTGGAGAALFSMVLSIGVQSGLITGELASIISIVMIAYGGWNAVTSNAANGIRTLAIASTLVQTASLANQISISGFGGKGGKLEELRSESEKTQSELEDTQNLVDEVNDSTRQAIIPPGITHRYADTYYAMAYGELGYNYDMLYNYDILYNVTATESLT